MAVEKTFGILKRRFRRLKFFNEYQDIQFIVQIVIACCILHNICIDSFDDGMDLYDEDNGVDVNLDERENQRNGDTKKITIEDQVYFMKCFRSEQIITQYHIHNSYNPVYLYF